MFVKPHLSLADLSVKLFGFELFQMRYLDSICQEGPTHFFRVSQLLGGRSSQWHDSNLLKGAAIGEGGGENGLAMTEEDRKAIQMLSGPGRTQVIQAYVQPLVKGDAEA